MEMKMNNLIKKETHTLGQPFGWLRGSDPFSQLKEEMDELFNSYIPSLPSFGRTDGGQALAMPTKLDFSETDDAIELVMDVPGIERKDIDISLSESGVKISGKREEKKEEKGRNFHRMERAYGAFERLVPLPCEVNAAKVDAKLKDGVLSITLPKSETARQPAKKITIKAE
jgi:HSP20 family protein